MRIRISLAADTGWFKVRSLREGARHYRISPMLDMWCRRRGTRYYVFHPAYYGPYLPSIQEQDMRKYFETIRHHGNLIPPTPEQAADIEHNLDLYLNR